MGSGLYFWENNLERAYEWAMEKERRGIIQKAAVIGAFISLNHCCDLLDYRFTNLVSGYHDLMIQDHLRNDAFVPKNLEARNCFPGDRVKRLLDFKVIEYMHRSRHAVHSNDFPPAFESLPFDTVRAAFVEGPPAYEGAGFRMKTHIQICVRNLNSILGFFRPRQPVDFRAYQEEHLLREDEPAFHSWFTLQ